MKLDDTSLVLKMLLCCIGLFLFSTFSAQTQFIDEGGEVSTGLEEMAFEDSSFRQDSIIKLLRLIDETPYRDLRGLVVIEKNKIVIEKHYNTFWRITIHDIRSAGKSITALLLGIAMKEGLVNNLEQSVYSFFPKDKYPTLNKDYKKITLKHLLDMSSGLDADTNDMETTGHSVHWMSKPDWKPYLLSVSLTGKPGEKWSYADIHAVLIGAIIEETSGMSLKDFAREKLFKPLGIEQFYWYTNSSNQTGAAGNLYISAVDFAKLGLLVSNTGKWKDTQLIESDYMKELVESRTLDVSHEMGKGTFYGMLWYKATKTLSDREIDYIWASGNGGNHLVVLPEDEIVIAVTSSAYGPGYGQGRSYTIWDKLLEALK